MKVTHLDMELLSAHADGELTGGERARAERHLGECATCRDRLRRLRGLVSAAGALPREVPPPDDVWQGIRSRLSLPTRRRRFPHAWLGAVAAAAAAVVMVAGASLLLHSGRSEKTRGAPALTRTPAAFAAVEDDYQASIAELRRTLEEQATPLSPATVRVLERSLAVIDTAIAEARAALAADPNNRAIARVLSAQYEQKLDLLQRATKLSPST